MTPQTSSHLALPSSHLLRYIGELEVEIDRLRRQSRLVREALASGLSRLEEKLDLARQAGANDQVNDATRALEHVFQALHGIPEMPALFAADDHVIAVALRPLAEQLFRWHKRLTGADMTLELRLEIDYIEWFPNRLRYILDNLISNAVRYRDSRKEENWVRIELQAKPSVYEIAVSDNGMGMTAAARERAFDLSSRAGPERTIGLGVGLVVAKLLIEQAGGALIADSGDGQGSNFRLVLPRFEMDDFLI